MILLYIFIGIILSIISAAPLGASNIAVITTTAKGSLSKGMRVAHGAGFGEVLLVFLAICYSKLLLDFFSTNSWIQATFTVIFFIIGILFLFYKKLNIRIKKPLKSKQKSNHILKGFLLALFNPPVLFYWIIAISLTQKYILPISEMSPWIILLLFFLGVYSGKVITLYLYGRWSHKKVQKQTKSKSNLYHIIGVALIILSTVQGLRFFIS